MEGEGSADLLPWTATRRRQGEGATRVVHPDQQPTKAIVMNERGGQLARYTQGSRQNVGGPESLLMAVKVAIAIAIATKPCSALRYAPTWPRRRSTAPEARQNTHVCIEKWKRISENWLLGEQERGSREEHKKTASDIYVILKSKKGRGTRR